MKITIFFLLLMLVFQGYSQEIHYNKVKKHLKAYHHVDLDSIDKKEIEWHVLSHDRDAKNELGSELSITYHDTITQRQVKWFFGIDGRGDFWLETKVIYAGTKSLFFCYEKNKLSAKGWGDLTSINRLCFYNETGKLSRILFLKGDKVFFVFRVGYRRDNWELYHVGTVLDLSYFGAEYKKMSFDR